MQVVLTVAGSSYISFQRAGITGLCQNTQLPHWIQCIQESWVAQLARSLSVSSLRQPTFYRLPLCLCAISVWIILCCCDKIPWPNAIHRTRFILAYISLFSLSWQKRHELEMAGHMISAVRRKTVHASIWMLFRLSPVYTVKFPCLRNIVTQSGPILPISLR